MGTALPAGDESPSKDRAPPANRLATAILVGRLHIVLIAALATLTFGWALTGTYAWVAVAACAIDWFIVNILNRVVDLPEDEANQIPGTAFAARHRTAIRIIGFSALVASLGAVHLLAPALLPWRLGYHALGLAYNWRLLPGGRRLKQLYAVKNLASAGGFLITCLAYPLAMPDSASHLLPDVSQATVLALLVYFLLFELSFEIIYDLRDIAGDREAGVATFPVVHGEVTAARIIDRLLIASTIVLATGYVGEFVPWRITVMLVGPLLLLAAYRRPLRRGVSSMDCIHLTLMGAGLLAGYQAWVLMRLPGV